LAKRKQDRRLNGTVLAKIATIELGIDYNLMFFYSLIAPIACLAEEICTKNNGGRPQLRAGRQTPASAHIIGNEFTIAGHTRFASRKHGSNILAAIHVAGPARRHGRLTLRQYLQEARMTER
jgi:hypothetical protein